MNSPKKLNYETRPLKFTERKMLLASLSRLINHFGNDYQYIGFGGLAFTDFKLFHKELHINKLYSVEAGDFSEEKIRYNCPFNFIKIIKKLSTEAFLEIDITKKSIIWLDYDKTLNDYFFNDVVSLFSKLPQGSIYIMSCNRELKSDKTRKSYEVEEFSEEFGDYIPFELTNKDFASSNDFKTIQKLLMYHINTTLKDRNNSENSDLAFKQIYNILYQENRGANMYTFGGFIHNNDFNHTDLNLADLDFISSGEEIYEIDIPNLTRKEIELANSTIYNDEKEKEIFEQKIISIEDLDKFKKTYKYLPVFYDIRM